MTPLPDDVIVYPSGEAPHQTRSAFRITIGGEPDRWTYFDREVAGIRARSLADSLKVAAWYRPSPGKEAELLADYRPLPKTDPAR